ncbi:MAG: hypothetical protein S4CHLAM102_04500 [Chlamydiia bacterium]|nr:hypothetical protein [Chlamydiia bacterium]
MTEPTNPTGPSSPNPTPPQSGPSSNVPGFTPIGGSGEDPWQSFKNFLGPEGYKKFMNGLCQSINQDISRQTKKMHEASEKLKRAELGEDDIN